MMESMTSRERMLRALGGQPVDRIPCCFMSFTALRKRVGEDFFELARAEKQMGLDTMLFIPSASRAERPEHPDLRGLPLRFAPEVETRQWLEQKSPGGDVLCREYRTPAGPLSSRVRLSEDWPYGEHLPLIDDYQIPRLEKALIEGRRDLEALRYLLVPPSLQDVARFRLEAGRARQFAQEEEVLLAGGWGVGADMACWLCGMQEFMLLTMERPDVAAELLNLIHAWNLMRMKVVLEAGVDLFIRRAWYEGCDFLTPRFFREAVLPQLKVEVDCAHEQGVRFGYICSSGTLPMVDLYLEAGLDALIGIDPVQGTHTDLSCLKERLGNRVCLWGGVSGALTVEMGTEPEIRSAVRKAVETLGPYGFILCPVDNITVDQPRTWRNLDVFIDEWRRNVASKAS